MGAKLSFPTVDLSGKVAVVTGGNTGIGYETAKALAVMGAQTIIACRSEERAVGAIERMKREVADEFPEQQQIEVEYMQLDLASFHSVRVFVHAFQQRNHPLHILINNAGVSFVHFAKTEDGFETHYQTNHLGPFLLTLELLPLILDTASNTGDCRIVFVSSRRYSSGVFDPSNMNGEHSYSRTAFYNHSKLYNVMTAYAMQRRLHKVGVTVSSLHPGLTDTEMTRHMHDLKMVYATVRVLKRTSVYRKPTKGAATSINCAVNPQLNSQQCLYYVDCKPVQTNRTSRNEEFQEQLWEISVNAVKDYLSPEVLEKYGTSHRVEYQTGVLLHNQGSDQQLQYSPVNGKEMHKADADTTDSMQESQDEKEGEGEGEGEEEGEEEEAALITTGCDHAKEMYSYA